MASIELFSLLARQHLKTTECNESLQYVMLLHISCSNKAHLLTKASATKLLFIKPDMDIDVVPRLEKLLSEMAKQMQMQ